MISQRRAATFAAGVLLLGAGCESRHTLTVNLASGYQGDVSVTCTADVRTDVTVQVDAQGKASAACPERSPRLTVYRDGQEISPKDIQWLETGDGIVTRLTFSVR